MQSSPQSCNNKSMVNKSDAYRFLFSNAYYPRSKTLTNSNSREFEELHWDNIAEKSNDNMNENSEWGRSAKSKRKLSFEQIFCSVSEQSCKFAISNGKSEWTQEHDQEKLCIGNCAQKSTRDVNLFNEIRMISDIDWGLINSLGEKNEDQPWILLDNDDIDGLLIPSNDALAFSESYKNECFSDRFFAGEEEWFDHPNLQNIQTVKKQEISYNFASNEINNTNDTTKSKIWDGGADEIKRDKSKYNNFSLGRTWFRTMSNYYKSLFEPHLKNWENEERIDQKTSMDELVINFIYKEFDISEDFSKSDSFQSFLDWMITILHSHNHRKSDDYIK